MSEQTWWESVKNEGSSVVERIKDLIHQGNVRRVVIQQQGQTIAEFPLTGGLIGVARRRPQPSVR